MSVKLTLTPAEPAELAIPKPPPLPVTPPPLPPVLDALPVDDAVELGGRLDQCPRCQGKLISPESLGWCQKCGYCRTLEVDKARVGPAQPVAHYRPAPSRFEVLVLIARLPSWVWVMTAGVVGIVLCTYLPGRRLPNDSFARAVWCSLQLAGGLLLLWGTQFWTLLLVADKDDKLGCFDIFLSGRLWGTALRRLPRTRWQICLGVWAVTLMAAALFLLGGLEHWLHYLPRSSTLPG